MDIYYNNSTQNHHYISCSVDKPITRCASFAITILDGFTRVQHSNGDFSHIDHNTLDVSPGYTLLESSE